MTHESINLLPQRKEAKKVASTAFYATLGSFFVIFFIAIVLIMFSLYLRSRLATLDNQEKNLRSQIAEQSVRRDKLLVTSERLTAIRKVLSERKELSAFISGVLDVIPPDFEIAAVNADTDSISFSLVSDDLANFDTLLSETFPKIGKDKTSVKTIEITSFSENSGVYTLGIVFNVDPALLVE